MPSVPLHHRERYSFANLDEVLALPDLIAIQRESFDWFLAPGPGGDVPRHQPDQGLHRDAPARAGVRPRRRRPAPAAEVHGGGVQGEGHDLLRADLRAGPLHERHHRRDQGADGLHGGLPDDDRQGHVRHQRHRAGRRVAARPLARASSSSRASGSACGTWPSTSSSPAPSTPTAVSGSSSTSSRSRARTSPPAPASPASAACRSSCCSAPSATTRRTRPGFLDALRAPLRLPRGPVGEGPRARAHPGRGAGRDLQAGPPGRAAVGRVGPGLLPQRLLRDPPLRPQPGRPLQAQPQARPRARQARASCSACSTTLEPARRADQPRAQPRARSSPRAPTCCTWPRRAGLPPRRPGPLRQPPHPLGRRADPEPGPHRPVPHGAGRARAHDDPGRRGDHAPDADQHPAGGRRHQGVLRHQPAVAVHGPGEPAVGPDPPPAPVGARPRWSVP